VTTYVPRDDADPQTYRRAVYHQTPRAARLDLLSDFDCPDPAAAVPRRTTTTSPLQALVLMNHEFSWAMAEAFAERVRQETADDDPDEQARRAFQCAYARLPDAEEQQAAAQLIRQHGLPALCRAILNSNELIWLP
jgi:hypothetical protein